MHDTTPYPATPDELDEATDRLIEMQERGEITETQAAYMSDRLWDAYHARLPDDWRMYLDPLYADTIKGAQARLRAAVLDALPQRIRRWLDPLPTH